jgi:protein arginine N-methyltransferase 1
MTFEDDYREDGHFEVVIGDERFLVPRFCPHRGGRLAFGTVNARRKTIICPLHHSVFSLETGEQLAGPTSSPLAVCKRDTPCR